MCVLKVVLCVFVLAVVVSTQDSSEYSFVKEQCCVHGEAFARKDGKGCSGAGTPEDFELEPEEEGPCKSAVKSCCEDYFKSKSECTSSISLSKTKQCFKAKTEIGKNCCEECSLGTWTGETQGEGACGDPPSLDVSPSTALRKEAFRTCCLEAVEKAKITTPKPTEPTTVKKKLTTLKPNVCEKRNSCQHKCTDVGGKPKCSCNKGYRLAADGFSCTDVNECAGSDDVCTEEGTVCHNTLGSYKCVQLKRDVGLTCPPGFKQNLENHVCDDINECQLPVPPCPKYLCENTIGGFTCAGKPGIISTSGEPSPVSPAVEDPAPPKDDMCPPGFRAGPDNDCVDIDECAERLDDCQRLSQYCINSHGSFFCQDHVSKRCAPGFKVNEATKICEDIDECENGAEVCPRGEVCVNLPGAYNCKSKISTLPKFSAPNKCQEGTRMRPGSNYCEDINECAENTHLCDPFQNCINTYGGHECRCKNGYELDHSTGSCVDTDECAMKLHNCPAGQVCENLPGSYTCVTRRTTESKPTITTSTLPPYEYEYYDSNEIPPEDDQQGDPLTPIVTATTSTLKPTTTPRPITTPRLTTTPRTTTPIPTTPRTTTPIPTTPRTTTPIPTTPRTTTPIPTTPRTTTPWPIAPRSTKPYRPLPPFPSPARPTPPTYYEPKTNPTTGQYPNYYNNYPTTTPLPPTEESPRNNDDDNKNNDADFNPENLHCLEGYVKNENNECVEIDECERYGQKCSSVEKCVDQGRRFVCECISGYQKTTSGICERIPLTSSTTTPRVPEWTYTRSRPTPRQESPCEMGYRRDPEDNRCVDIDECATGRAICSADEHCMNTPGGYNCVCARNCSPRDKPRPPVPSSPTVNVEPNKITIGSQFGQRGPRYLRPMVRQGPYVHQTSCAWGYTFTEDKRRCVDIDECATNKAECGPEQRCENFFGGYFCKCPPGHRMIGNQRCEDIDECSLNRPCSSFSECVNTVGSYTCRCGEGFRNAASNDKMCVDVDECREDPNYCQQDCNNVWGSFRCSCRSGYRLQRDNRTCEDIDECAEWKATGRPGRLCAGDCVNVAGSYRCECPPGYKTSADGMGCNDINECENGEATCARSKNPAEVCQNTRGGYHCHTIVCPDGYQLEGGHRCTRIQRTCRYNDRNCLHQPGTYNYNYISIVSKMYIPYGSVDLFTMHGPAWGNSVINFHLDLVDVQAGRGVKHADLSCFDIRTNANVCVVSLLCSLEGPQTAELELKMSLYQRDNFAGTAIAKLIIIVSQYEF